VTTNILMLADKRHLIQYELEYPSSTNLPAVVVCEGKVYMKMLTKAFTYMEVESHWVDEVEDYNEQQTGEHNESDTNTRIEKRAS
jgi:hypothetical protein